VAQRRRSKSRKPLFERMSRHLKALWVLIRRSRPKGPVQTAVLAMIWGVILAGLLLGWYAYEIPDILRRADLRQHQTILLEDRNGTVFARFGGYRGEAVSVDTLPPHLVKAFLAVEDRRFYEHGGIDYFGILRATVTNFFAGRVVQGGSTITQQLAKNLFLGPQRTFRRKIQEAMLAMWIEKKYDKDEILSSYLNRVYLGSGAYGVDAAAQLYFGKPAHQVNLREAAILAGLPRAPTRYSPLNDPEAALGRGRVVLQAMVDSNFINEKQKENAIGPKTTLAKRKPGRAFEGYYFADWVMEQASGLIGEQDESEVEPQDIIIRTTLDLAMQRTAERQIASILESEGAKRQVSQGALVSMGFGGAVRSLVGGKNYTESSFNRATQAKRQPGSAFKPFIYLDAYLNGYPVDSTIADAPLKIGNWSPTNYDGGYRGQVTLKDALAYSLNAATVRLAQKLRISEVRNLAQRLGIRTPIAADLSLALGTSEVTLLDLTGAYAVFAAGGQAVEPYGIQYIKTRNGHTLYKRDDVNMPQLVDGNAIAMLNDSLQAVVAYGTGRRANYGGETVAGKTGTTQDYRDAWFVGYTSHMVTGVWMGNDDNKPMDKITGGTLPAGLWRNYMSAVADRAGDDPGLGSSYSSRQLGNFQNFLENLFGGKRGTNNLAPPTPSEPEPEREPLPQEPSTEESYEEPLDIPGTPKGMTLEPPESPIQED
jgi:penicillin-binding protein 1A